LPNNDRLLFRLFRLFVATLCNGDWAIGFVGVSDNRRLLVLVLFGVLVLGILVIVGVSWRHGQGAAWKRHSKLHRQRAGRP
jgi:hypothetical protein